MQEPLEIDDHDTEFINLGNGKIILPVSTLRAIKDSLIKNEPIQLAPGGRVIKPKDENMFADGLNPSLARSDDKLTCVSENAKADNEDLDQQIKQSSDSCEPSQLNAAEPVINQNEENASNDDPQPRVVVLYPRRMQGFL